MSFYQEPAGYQKTILSDLQGAWENLRSAVVKNFKTVDCSKLLFHIDEAMSWESVRNLSHMRETFLLVQSLAQQLNLADEVMMSVEDVREILYETLDEIKQGDKL